MEVTQDLVSALQARLPGIHLRTLEESRALEALRQTVNALSGPLAPRVLWRWSSASGLAAFEPGEDGGTRALADPCGFDEALNAFRRSGENVILAMLDPWDELARPVFQRCLREALAHARGSGKAIVLVGRDWQIPPELQADLFLCGIRLPRRAELQEFIQSLAVLYAERLAGKVSIEKESIPELARACTGLSLDEARSIVALSLVRYRSIGVEAVKMAIREKKQIVGRGGLLEYEEADRSMAEVGGLVHLKAWISKRGRLFNDKARKLGIYAPHGVLLVGIPGTGKTLAARAIAATWNLPLIRLDAGRLFGSLVGESEANLRAALRTAEAIAPAVMLVDEIEKAFGQGGGLDGGTSSRVFGSLLSWLQDKKADVFVCATANDVTKLPPELLRKGRFDEIFFVDLPDAESRADILRIHLARTKCCPVREHLDQLARISKGYTGSELEAAVQSALIEAFSQSRGITPEDIAWAIKATVPLSKTMAEPIDRLREFYTSGRAIAAGGTLDEDDVKAAAVPVALDIR